ncbi:AbrB/MazE/SpoVT family DNA-binding domain-containing protein [soil metagenome]
MATKVTDDGQVTIPKHVLEQLGIGPGSEVDFRFAADGSVVLERATNPRTKTELADLVGVAGPGMPTDELMALLRGD